jgi:hypothetical protein
MIGKTIKGNGFDGVWRYIYDKVKKPCSRLGRDGKRFFSFRNKRSLKSTHQNVTRDWSYSPKL